MQRQRYWRIYRHTLHFVGGQNNLYGDTASRLIGAAHRQIQRSQ